MTSLPIHLEIWKDEKNQEDEFAINARVVDRISGETIVDFRIPSDMIVSALEGLVDSGTVQAEIGNLYRVGKIKETSSMKFSMPLCPDADRIFIARQIASSLCPKGWSVDESAAEKSLFIPDGAGGINAVVPVAKWRNRQPGDDDTEATTPQLNRLEQLC